MSTDDVQVYTKYKSIMFGVAYRMLGSVSDAEDIVQDVFIHYLQRDMGDVRNEQAYLTKMTVNRCLNLLQSARRKREIYTGPWLPEPLADDEYARIVDPAERREKIGYAFLVLMQKLSPLERAIYVLREVLQYDYRMIAEMLDKSETSCRKTFSRAKEKAESGSGLHAMKPLTTAQERFVEAFIKAADLGNFASLHEFLLGEVTLLSDGGGKAKAALNPILGLKRVTMFFDGLAAKGSFVDGFTQIDLNGEPGIMLKRDGEIVMTLCTEWGPSDPGPVIQSLYLVVNPDKLTRFNRSSPDTTPS